MKLSQIILDRYCLCGKFLISQNEIEGNGEVCGNFDSCLYQEIKYGTNSGSSSGTFDLYYNKYKTLLIIFKHDQFMIKDMENDEYLSIMLLEEFFNGVNENSLEEIKNRIDFILTYL